MNHAKLRDLEISLQDGIITKEEYEKKKKEIEDMPDPETIEVPENQKFSAPTSPIKEELKDVKLRSDKILIIGAIILVIIFGVLISARIFDEEIPKTVDELHDLNLQGKLKPEQGYLYNNIYSFVKFDDLWFTQFKSPKGTILYDVQFRYGPREVEDIIISGTLNDELFNDAKQYYATFNPLGNDFTHIRLARLDYDIQMTNIFFKKFRFQLVTEM